MSICTAVCAAARVFFSGKGETNEPHENFQMLRENDVLLQDAKRCIDVVLPENRQQYLGQQLHSMLTNERVRESDDIIAFVAETVLRDQVSLGGTLKLERRKSVFGAGRMD